MNHQICPKCHYQRQAADSQNLPGVCPACGIAYDKWLAMQARTEQADPEILYVEPHVSIWVRIKNRALEIPERVDELSFWGRSIVFVVFFFWGWSFIFGGIDWMSIFGSFLHQVILPFHEFGHVLFSPLGRFMAILGGSLFQVVMPLGLMVAFILKQRDTFGASMMLWWCGQSFIDLSPYIIDAPYRSIPLIGGLGEEAHDWGNLLTMTGSLDHATGIARFSFALGSLFILLSYCWGGYLLYQQYQRRNHPLDEAMMD